MVSPVNGLLAIGILSGLMLWWAGYRVVRLTDQLGRLSFVSFALILGTGCIATGVAGLVPSVFTLGSSEGEWAQIPLLFWLISTLPWFVFALQYTGTRTKISRRKVVLLSLPQILIAIQLLLDVFNISSPAFNAVGTVVFIYLISLAVAGTYLILQTTYSYGHIPLGQGLSLALVPLGTLILWNLMSTQSGTPPLGKAGAYAVGSALAGVGVGTAFIRYDLFDSTPSIGTLGRRGLTRETDDLMFVVNDDDHVITINEPAAEALELARSAVVGGLIDEILGHDVEELRQSETVSKQTIEGRRQYDPQVSRVRDHHGNVLGATVSLRDVTDRELREQRLAVLNRVLRHNLRNQVEVVKSHAGALNGADPVHVDAICDAADAIATLGRTANKIDGYVSESQATVAVNLEELVQSILETVGAREAEVSLSVDVPSSAGLVTNKQAVASALESAIDNAVTYADSKVDIEVDPCQAGYCIRISDNGPGIPEWELDSLDTGTESPLEHSTGLGLWQIKWAVMTVNGQLSFDTTDGTTIEIVVPDGRKNTTTTT